MRKNSGLGRVVLVVGASLLLIIAIACTETVEVPGETVVVEKVVTERIEVPGETVVKEVVKEVMVPGETVVVKEEVVKEVQVPGETVVVEKVVTETVEVPGETITVEVVKEVMVPGETVVVEKEVVKTVEVPGETIVVEKEVVKTVEVIKTVEVPTIVTKVVVERVEVMREPKGTLRVAEVVPGLTQLQSKDASGSVGGVGVAWQVYEGIINPQLTDPGVIPSEVLYEPQLARSWVVAHDLTSITFSIRDDVVWHDNWGRLTAEDVVWTYNNSFEDGSVGNAGDQLTKGHRVGWEVTGPHTAVMNVADGEFNTTWGVYHGGFGWDNTYGMVCKSCYETLGEDEFMTTPIGTGPYKATKWVANDEAIMEWTGSHWKYTPYVHTVHVVDIPELSVREAALRTGEVDIAPVAVPNLPEIVESTGGTGISFQSAWPQVINVSGNYWAEFCSECPEGDQDWKNNPRPGYTPDADHPWIGKYGDDESMEKARKVRWAMAMAIDRDLIVDTVMNGFSEPVYIAFHTQFGQGTPYWKDEWFVPYDPEMAKQYMTEAGYGDGFSLEFWSTNSYPQTWNPEVMDAVALMWREHLDLDVTLDRTPYPTRRPETVTHEMNIPWHHGWGVPAGRSIAQYYCAWPGHIMGVALPNEICDVGFQNNFEKSVEKRIANNIFMQDYIQHWMTNIGVVNLLPHYVYTPRVQQWQPYYGNRFNHPASVILSE